MCSKLHDWRWANGAPEIGVPLGKRTTSVVEECAHCGVVSAWGPKNTKRYLSCRATLTPQPLCPDTCDAALAVQEAFREVDSRS
jgi:hypothetical protein